MGPLGILPRPYWLHGIAYATLSIFLAYTFHTSKRPDWQVLVMVFIVVTMYGVAIEVIQIALPRRSFDTTDILSNGFGSAIAVTGWRLLLRYVHFYRIRNLKALHPTLK